MTDFGSYFEKMYRLNSDPWNYAESPYEGQKYDATCAALRSDHYRHGIEIGCSIGALSARLAVRCDRFLAIDLVGKAVEQASTRLADIPGASAMVGQIPYHWPNHTFDLIVLSEVLYYLTPQEITLLARKIKDTTLPGAECVLVNWRGQTDTPITGIGARTAFCDAMAGLTNFATHPNSGTPDYDHVTLVLP